MCSKLTITDKIIYGLIILPAFCLCIERAYITGIDGLFWLMVGSAKLMIPYYGGTINDYRQLHDRSCKATAQP